MALTSGSNIGLEKYSLLRLYTRDGGRGWDEAPVKGAGEPEEDGGNTAEDAPPPPPPPANEAAEGLLGWWYTPWWCPPEGCGWWKDEAESWGAPSFR